MKYITYQTVGRIKNAKRKLNNNYKKLSSNIVTKGSSSFQLLL